MPPRYAYWTIIAGGLPTAFRAAEREDLLPTYQRIRERHPDAIMKWFARGKLWDSPEAARVVRPRDRRPGAKSPDRESRGRDWRPGGEHRDPRQPFINAKKQRNAALRKERWERRNETAEAPKTGGASARQKPAGSAPKRSFTHASRPRRVANRPPRGPRR